MATLHSTPPATLDTDIFLRLWEKERLTPTLARHILKLKFPEVDDTRMRELAQRNSRGKISRTELAELDEFLRVATVLSILQSRARKLLRKDTAMRNGSD